MEIRFSELGQMFFRIENLYAIYQRGGVVNHYKTPCPRPTDALLFFYCAKAICKPKGKPSFPVEEGSVMFLPAGSEYSWEVVSPDGKEPAVNLLFEFSLYGNRLVRGHKGELSVRPAEKEEKICFGQDIFCVSHGHHSLYEELYLSLIAAFEEAPAKPLATYAAAYRLLSAIAEDCRKQSAQSPQLALIREGVRILEEEEAPEKSLAEIAALCGVSVSYFERLFRQYAGISPAEYRTAHRIAAVKKQLATTDLSLAELAEKFGFYDAAYLCRAFRRQTGLTPRQYRQAAKEL